MSFNGTILLTLLSRIRKRSSLVFCPTPCEFESVDSVFSTQKTRVVTSYMLSYIIHPFIMCYFCRSMSTLEHQNAIAASLTNAITHK